MATVGIVGAGLAGLRTAESLRRHGFSDRIVIIGEEPQLPYNRPPLSKDALARGMPASSLEFPRRASLDDVEWLLEDAVDHADLSNGRLHLSSGQALKVDAVVAASGVRPRRLPVPRPAAAGPLSLRTVSDAVKLRDALARATSVAIVGSGFIGCEVAATATTMGLDVTVVSADDEPLIRPLGREFGSSMRRRHERAGVRFLLGQAIAAYDGGAVTDSVVLADGTIVSADVVLEAVGSQPNVDWLEGAGPALDDGLETDHDMRVTGNDVPLFAVGDLARHPNALFGDDRRRVEHWNIALETGRRAGEALARLLADEPPLDQPFTAMPSFWSDQYQYSLQAFGMPGLGAQSKVAEGELDEACIVEYHDDAGLVGVVGIDSTSRLLPYRKELMRRV